MASGDVAALSTFQPFKVFPPFKFLWHSDALPSLEPLPSFKLTQDITFGMRAHAVRSTWDVPNSYVTILLMFLQTVVRHPQGLSALERAIPWADLA